jgi:hypothetical protein
MSKEMPDALAAAALVGAILAVLFGLWQVEIDKALAAPKSDDKKNRGPSKAIVESALKLRAWPLFCITALTFLVLVVRAGWIVFGAISCMGASCVYDDVQALFLLTEGLVFVLWLVVWQRIRALKAKLRDLDS